MQFNSMLHQSEGGIEKSMHKLTRDFSRGKVDLFLEPNTYQIFTQFSMFAFKGICQASWLDLSFAGVRTFS